MPKIFLIKNRLHQQQQKLLESQNLLSVKHDERLGSLVSNSPPTSDSEPLSLVARHKKDNHSQNSDNSDGKWKHFLYSFYIFMNTKISS